MVDLSVLPGFVAMILLFLAPPGPDMAFVAAAGLRGGRPAAIRAILGIGTGMGAYAVLVAVGLARVVERWPLALDAIRLAGAAYLLWLAWASWRDARHAGPPTAADAGNHYVRGLLVSLGNPKLILFFLAVLPQFVGRASSTTAQLALLGGVNVAAEVVAYGAVGLLVGTVGTRAGRSGRRPAVLARVVAAVYAVLAAVFVGEVLLR